MPEIYYQVSRNPTPIVLRIRPGPTSLRFIDRKSEHREVDDKTLWLLSGLHIDYYLASAESVNDILDSKGLRPLLDSGLDIYFWSYLSERPHSFHRDSWHIANFLLRTNTSSHLFLEMELPVDRTFTVGGVELPNM